MPTKRTNILIGFICLIVSLLAFAQYNSQQAARAEVPHSSSDQATYISRLYESTTQLQQQANELDRELRQYQSSDTNVQSNLDNLMRDVQKLSLANGEVEAVGPGVTVMAEGDLTVFELQDLVNELRNASAEAIAVNGVRVVTRSAIVVDQAGRITVDRQPLTRPFRLEAIGEPDTLLHALQRKGGLIALLEVRNSGLQITVAKHDTTDKAGWLKLPKTALSFTWVYGQPTP